jgi:transcriptional regulator with XRE-family HTH domain
MSRKNDSIHKCQELHWRHAPCHNSFFNRDLDQSAENVGHNLRRLREERNLTIRSLAQISGLSVNTLSLIENGKSSPSVKSLLALSESLNFPITSFFDHPKRQDRIIYVKDGTRPVANLDYGKLENLGACKAIPCVEPFVLTLEPLAVSHSHDVVHTGYEFVYCLQGRIAYTILYNVYLLNEGDSVLFEAHFPHCWQNLSTSISKCILVLFSSDDRDSPTQSHFLAKY